MAVLERGHERGRRRTARAYRTQPGRGGRFRSLVNPFARGHVPHRKRPESESGGPAYRREPIENVPLDPVDDERVLQPAPNLFSRQTKRAAALGAVLAALAGCTNPLAARVPDRPILLREPTAAQTARLVGAGAASAAGDYILATPTNGADNDENSGIWFLSLASGAPAVGGVARNEDGALAGRDQSR